jgi:hypothetical protein
MATTIKLKNSVTTTNAPSSLEQGEVAINITDKKVWVGNAATTPIQLLGAGGSASFGALTCTSLTNSGLTSGRVTYAGTGGVLQDDADFTFNGTTVTMANDASISGLTVGKGGGANSSNTALGNLALTSTVPIIGVQGVGNTAVGGLALQLTTTGYYNNALGYASLNANTSGVQNNAFGYFSLVANTTGSNNSAFGHQALQANTTASNNTAVGYQAGYSNTTGTENQSFGYKALYATTTSSGNNAFGTYALNANTTGANNTALGNYALGLNTTASNNTAVGYQAGYSNTTGAQNTHIGRLAGYSSTTATSCTYVGNNAGYTNSTGVNNTFVGDTSGYFTTGGNNTFIGLDAGYLVTTGQKNTILGKYNGNTGGLDIRTASNYIVLSDGDGNPRVMVNPSGYTKLSNNGTYNNATGSQHEIRSDATTETVTISNSNASFNSEVVIAQADRNTTNNSYYFYRAVIAGVGTKFLVADSGNVTNTNGSYGTISDVKNKENIVDATPKLDKIKQLQVRNFNFKGDELKQIGFIAQEFEQVFPSMIEEHHDKDAEGNDLGTTTKSIKTSVLVPILVKAVQELTAKVEALEAQLNK